MSTLEEYVKEQEASATDFEQLLDQLESKLCVVLYSDLNKMSDIRNVFRRCDDAIIFFPVESNDMGHYVALLYYPELNLINYFCPYGMSVMDDIRHSTTLMTKDPRTREALPRLLDAFIKSGGTVNINYTKLQKMTNGISTCGKHCTMRIKHKDIVNPEDYARFLKYKNLTPDEIVTLVFM